jgi:arginyl-tRNA synthetase
MNEQLQECIGEVVRSLFDIDIDIKLTRPEEFGDFSTNVAMQLAGRLENPPAGGPREIAGQIVDKLAQNDLFDNVEAAGPGFINMTISAKKMADSLHTKWSPSYGENNDGEGKTVVVEYPSPNMAKPYSVGHLRPANQGWAVARLMQATGWKVITDNHLGDYGAPFGIWVVGFLKFSSDDALAKDGVYELGRVYIATKKALKDEAAAGGHELADEVQNWLIKLEKRDPEAEGYSKRFNEISLEHIHHIMKRLNISTDFELGEAFFAPKGKEAVQKLLASGVATQNDDGSIIVTLDEQGIDVPILVQKSNGAALYATTDLATILYREENWQPDRVIYVVGSEQQFYFSQLFALAKKMGIDTEFIHYWFGVIDQMSDGVREKMSSRKGVVLLEELLDKAEEKARHIVENRSVSDTDIQRVSLGAIKFSDFMSDKRTNILFDWDKIFALSGYSGPYVQYAAVRVNKILQDNQIDPTKTEYDYGPEKEAIAKLLEYPNVVRISAENLEPHRIATYLYELAREMNRYYEKTPVATPDVPEPEKIARLGVLQKVSQVFSHGLGILGIEVPEKM